jgi:hypothetical protein
MSRNSAPGAGIDGSEGEDFLTRGKDDGDRAARDISTSEFKTASDPWSHDTWKPGKLPHKGDSAPRYAPKGDSGTKQVEAISRTSKGQRMTLGSKGGDKYEE